MRTPGELVERLFPYGTHANKRYPGGWNNHRRALVDLVEEAQDELRKELAADLLQAVVRSSRG